MIDGVMPLLNRLEEKVKPIEDLFNSVSYNTRMRELPQDISASSTDWRVHLLQALERLQAENAHLQVNEFHYALKLYGFKKSLNHPYFEISVNLYFNEYSFILFHPNGQQILYPYRATALQPIIEQLTDEWVSQLIDNIRKVAGLS
jgi:hypothetical protein